MKLSSTLHVCKLSTSALPWKHLLGFLPWIFLFFVCFKTSHLSDCSHLHYNMFCNCEILTLQHISVLKWKLWYCNQKLIIILGDFTGCWKLSLPSRCTPVVQIWVWYTATMPCLQILSENSPCSEQFCLHFRKRFTATMTWSILTVSISLMIWIKPTFISLSTLTTGKYIYLIYNWKLLRGCPAL